MKACGSIQNGWSTLRSFLRKLPRLVRSQGERCSDAALPHTFPPITFLSIWLAPSRGFSRKRIHSMKSW